MLNISNQQYSYYESGRSKLTVEQLIKIAEYFEKPVSFFVGEENVSREKHEELQAKYIALLEGKQEGSIDNNSNIGGVAGRIGTIKQKNIKK